MAGYSWQDGKSNNAVAAEAEGLMVASKFAQWVRRWKPYRGCTAADVAAALDPCEYHHTSKFFNSVNYYDPGAMMYEDCRTDLAETIARRKHAERMWRDAERRGWVIDGRITMISPEFGSWYQLSRGELLHDARKRWAHNRVDFERLAHQLEHGYAANEFMAGWRGLSDGAMA